ncbi:MAG: S1 family peptidase [Bdellovibrionales bacterium]
MRFIFLSAVIILSWQAGAAQNSPAWVGFKASDDTAIPESIRNAAQAVFQIIFPHGTPEIKDVAGVDIKTMSRDDKEWFKIVQVKVCQNQKIKNCPIMPGRFSGTAFLIKDGSTIATNLHNIQSWLYYAKKYNPELSIEDIQSPIALADENQDLAFSPMQTEVSLKLSFYNKTPELFKEDYPWEVGPSTLLFRASDYVEMHCSIASDRTPLQFGKIFDHDEDLYLIGFPGPTSVFAKHGGQDSPGSGRWTSVGKILPRASLENINIMTSIAAAPGSSGSPALNAKGEVVGIVFSGESDETDGNLTVEAQLLQTDLVGMRKIWSLLHLKDQN